MRKIPNQNSDHGNIEDARFAPRPKPRAHGDWLDERGIEDDERARDDGDANRSSRIRKQCARNASRAEHDGRPNQRDEDRNVADREMPTRRVRVKFV